jgi:hypothetical protein
MILRLARIDAGRSSLAVAGLLPDTAVPGAFAGPVGAVSPDRVGEAPASAGRRPAALATDRLPWPQAVLAIGATSAALWSGVWIVACWLFGH